MESCPRCNATVQVIAERHFGTVTLRWRCGAGHSGHLGVYSAIEEERPVKIGSQAREKRPQVTR